MSKEQSRDRYKREMDLDETACRICSLIAKEQSLPDPEHSCLDHMHYHARTLETNADECYKASLELIFAHVADIHMVILKILSARYGHSVPDMLQTVMNHDDYKNIYLHPVLKSLVYFNQIDEGTTIWKKRIDETKSVLQKSAEQSDESEKKQNIIEVPKPKKSKPLAVSRKKIEQVALPEPLPAPEPAPVIKKSKPAIIRKKVKE